MAIRRRDPVSDSSPSRASSKARQRTSVPPPPDLDADRNLAGRLETDPGTLTNDRGALTNDRGTLTNDEVEQVLGRAAEIDSGLDTDAIVDVAALIAAAREVGLSEGSIRQAIAEMRAGESEPTGFLERLLVGDEIVEVDTVDINVKRAGEILDSWMRNAEGLRPARVDNDVVTWQRDGRFSTRLRKGLGREATGLPLDGLSRVSHSISEIGPAGSLIALRADTKPVRQIATGALGGTAVVGSAAAVPLLAMSDSVGQAALVLTATGVGAGGIASAIVIATRIHVGQMRDALRRPIDAVSRAEPMRETAQIVDAVVDRISEIRQRRSKRRA